MSPGTESKHVFKKLDFHNLFITNSIMHFIKTESLQPGYECRGSQDTCMKARTIKPHNEEPGHQA